MNKQSIYGRRGVSSSKAGVHAATRNLDDGLYPGAFCKLIPDVAGDVENYVSVLHADGAGTKAGLAYLAWREDGKTHWWAGIAQDALVMNLDDLACVGCLGPFNISNVINRNALLLGDDTQILPAILHGFVRVITMLEGYGILCNLAGGETADLGDLVRTISVDCFVDSRLACGQIVNTNNIRPGNILVGFSSTGQASWESSPNSGMGSNGLTNARHDMLHPDYRRYTETYSPEIDPGLVYRGKYHLADSLPGDERFTVAQALLSPTRTYLPLLADIFELESFKLAGNDALRALIHCSGGGQTKIGKYGGRTASGLCYVIDRPFPVPPLFTVLKDVREMTWREMYQTYNMGWRMIAVVCDERVAQAYIGEADCNGIEARIIGQVEESHRNSNRVEIAGPDGPLIYDIPRC